MNRLKSILFALFIPIHVDWIGEWFSLKQQTGDRCGQGGFGCCCHCWPKFVCPQHHHPTLAVIIEIRSMSASVIACNWLNYNRPPSTIDHHRGGGLCIYCSLQINLSPPDRTVPGYGRTTNNLCTMAMGNCGLCFHFTSYTICSRIPSFKQEKGKLGKVELALGSTDCVLLNGLLGSR